MLVRLRAQQPGLTADTSCPGLRFHWDTQRLADMSRDFDIVPASGFVPANGTLSAEVFFHPQEVKSHIRYKNVPLIVEGTDTLRS